MCSYVHPKSGSLIHWSVAKGVELMGEVDGAD